MTRSRLSLLSTAVLGSSALLSAAGCSSAAPEDQASITQTITSCTAPAYEVGTYVGGDRVSNIGNEYECKPYPYSGWCGLGGAYEPGVGFAWQDAWIFIGACDGAPPAGCTSDADCDDGNTCTSNTCNADGTCSATNNTSACSDDGNSCTNDVCSGGTCTHPDNGTCTTGCASSSDCSDGSACTDDVCNADGTCSNPSNGSCDAATCDAPAWRSKKSYSTGDVVTRNGKEYTANWWTRGEDPELYHGPEGSGMPWRGPDACGGGPSGGCSSDADCNDGNVCTTDTCNGDGTCSNANNTASCADDGNACTADVCSMGSCTHPDNETCTTGCSSSSDCSDGDSCTADVCNTDGSCSNPSNGTCSSGSLSDVLSESLYNQMFPNRNALYTYQGLLNAAARYPTFATTGSDAVRRRELAAFLANISHETTGGWATAPGGPYAWGLYWIEEVACIDTSCTQYCASSSTYPCASGETYHGRGPMQLSWNYNYGQAGDALGLDLLNNPDLVMSNSTVAFETALWFWMTTQAPKPSAHDVMVGNWQPSSQDISLGRLPGFGMTINIINGGLECSQPTTPAVEDRVGFYDRYVTMLSTTQGENVYCDSMAHY